MAEPLTVTERRGLPLGRVVQTAGVAQIVAPDAVRAAIARHQAGDWGLCVQYDRAANDRAVLDGGRVVSVWTDGPSRFYVITEGDRSSTCVMLATEY